MQKERLFGKTLAELNGVASATGLPSFAGRQIAEWLYRKDISDISQMTNLSKKSREALSERYILGAVKPVSVKESADGTKKYLFPSVNGSFVETAYIPDKNRSTVCISSQVGCKMGCVFCLTGQQGFQGNLTSGEILDQYKNIPEWKSLTNIVYMGMGEPLDNLGEVLKSLEILTSAWGFGLSPKRITVSTIGIIPAMSQFLEQTKAHLAVSLHSPFDEERTKLIPLQKTYPLNEVLAAIRSREFSRQRRVSFEYILFKNLNDSPAHVNELAKILNGIKCRVNLIRYHPIPGRQFESPDEKEMITFRDLLNDKGIIATIRASRGLDIGAACGLLSTRALISHPSHR